MEKIIIDLGAGRLVAWRVSGARPPVVCVHGAGVSSRELRPFVAAMAGRRETWTFDLPGFGESSGLPEPIDLTIMARGLFHCLNETGTGPAHLLGCSFGCQVVVEVAARFPEQVRGLVLVGPTIDPLARTLPRQFWRWCRNSLHEPPRIGPLTLRDYRDAGARRVFSAFSASLADRIEEKLPTLAIPALVVRGEHDALVPQEWAEEVTRLLPHGRLTVWPKSAHMVPFSDPAGLARRVERFTCEARR